MQLGADTSVTTSDLIGLTRWYAHADDQVFTPAEVKGLLNRAQPLLQMKIMEAMDDWDFQGQFATTDLINSSIFINREYSWPVDLLFIKRMDAKFDGTNFVRVLPKDSRSIDEGWGGELEVTREFSNQAPGYEAFDQGFLLLSGTILTTVTGGLRIEYDQDLPTLSAITDEPIFPEGFHPWLCLWASQQYFIRYEQPDKARALASQLAEIEGEIKSYFAKRNQDKSRRARITMKRSSWHYL